MRQPGGGAVVKILLDGTGGAINLGADFRGGGGELAGNIGHHAVGILEQGDAGIVGHLGIDDGGHFAGNGLGHAEDPVHHVDGMGRIIGEDVPVQFGAGVPGGFEIAHVLGGQGMAAAIDGQLAQLAAFDDFLHLDVLGIHAHLPSHGEAHAGLFHGLNDAVRVLHIQGHGLVADDVLARRGGQFHHVGMILGLAGDDDRLNVAGQQLFRRGKGGSAQLFATVLSPLRVVIPAAGDLYAPFGVVLHVRAVAHYMAMGKSENANMNHRKNAPLICVIGLITLYIKKPAETSRSRSAGRDSGSFFTKKTPQQ